jgi:hypothetical protein
MFDATQLKAVVDLQERSFALLRWVNRGMIAGTLKFDTVHGPLSLADAADEWVRRHYGMIPESARPTLDQVRPFAYLFASYLATSYEVADTRTVSGGCHCGFCWRLLAVKNLRPRKVSKKAREEARQLKLILLRHLAAEMGLAVRKGEFERLLDEPGDLARAVSWAAYGQELLRRSEFASQGEGVLVLWREIAWDGKGRVSPKFRLTPEAFLAAEATMKERLAKVLDK